MSREPFVPTSNYPRRAGLGSKAKEHAKAVLVVAATFEFVASLHFLVGMLTIFPHFGWLGRTDLIAMIGALVNGFSLALMYRYSRHAGWSKVRLIGSFIVLAVGSVVAFFSVPVGFMAVGVIGAIVYRSIIGDLDARGITTYGNGMPKMELRETANAGPYEVTPLG